MYKRLGTGYLEPSATVNRRYDPADNELYSIVKTCAAAIDDINKQLRGFQQVLQQQGQVIETIQQQTDVLERRFLESSARVVEIEEIADSPPRKVQTVEIQNEQIPSPSTDMDSKDPEVTFDGSLGESTNTPLVRSPLFPDPEGSEPEAPSKRPSWGFWTIYSRLKRMIKPKATSESPTISLCDFQQPPKSSSGGASDSSKPSIQES